MNIKLLVTTLAIALASHSFAATATQPKAETPEQRDARMSWWREARFGMFVHWGLYSIPAGEWDGKGTKGHGKEWIQKQAGIPADVYEKRLYPQFNPKEGFAEEWAKAANMAGCKYIVFTTKHHEGFAMHDSAVTTFDAKDACGRDLLKEVVDATKAEGLKFGAYYSVIDWHHPHAYAGFGLPTVKGVTNQGRDNSIYVDYLHKQVEEIVTGYGDIDILWWDFSKPDCQGESWRAKELVSMVRKHQPNMVMNNRLYASKNSFVGADSNLLKEWDSEIGDFTTPEQSIPDTGVEGVDWETCMTMNKTWGYSKFDNNWKSSEELIRNLIDVVSKGGNYLLNIGPKADGSIPEQSVQRMQAIGKWMDVNSDAIYGTSASPFGKPQWGRYTSKADRLYAHVFDWPVSGKLTIPNADRKVSKVYLLADSAQNALPIESVGGGWIISLPSQGLDAVATVVVVQYE
ncbi:MAG: alpha-L-fucosidase [Opitutales bacterium]|nr:alpha-L-fucosidase [Opitutales bacterium]MDP4777766.1 alpha-L-fucosidase [Opitutales bacterium]MDP4884012.1 alpha-L-fucosidase [Opitutales bacterium]MDP5079609.1 alpha-L-fucosidase [Opitutales bacterium]